MIWFNLDVAQATLDDSPELAQKVLTMLGANDDTSVLFTSTHEIVENDVVLEDSVWDNYHRWQAELLNTGHHAQTEVFSHYDITLITAVGGKKIVQIVDHVFPALYVTKQD